MKTKIEELENQIRWVISLLAEGTITTTESAELLTAINNDLSLARKETRNVEQA